MPKAGRSAPTKTRRTFERIVDALKERISAGEYQPGDRLPAERTLSEQLRVGRPSIREAYRALELMGILEIRKGSDGGAYILAPDRRSAGEAISDLLRAQNLGLSALAEARIFIERGLAELAAERAEPEDFGRLRAILDRADEKIGLGCSAADESIDFHLALADACRNPMLATVHASLMSLLRIWLKRLGPMAQASKREQEEHRRLLAALVDRRPTEASRLMEEHLRRSKDRLEEFLSRNSPDANRLADARRPTADPGRQGPSEGGAVC